LIGFWGGLFTVFNQVASGPSAQAWKEKVFSGLGFLGLFALLTMYLVKKARNHLQTRAARKRAKSVRQLLKTRPARTANR